MNESSSPARKHERRELKDYTLSVVMPVYNEEDSIEISIARVLNCGVPNIELVVVNDASQDRTRQILEETDWGGNVRLFHHEENQGKGAALRTGFEKATGEVVIIQDADLEYDPAEYPRLLAPIEAGSADVVYGSRFAGGEAHRVVYFWHMLGNQLITLMSNMFTDLNLTDVETCYKVFRSEVLRDVRIEENRFGFEPEITAKIARGKRWRIYEVGISYHGRTYAEGKKIGWKDGFRAIYAILKYNLFR